MDLKPHKIRYWLHSPEKQGNPETFCEKVNEICDLYLNAQTLSQNGTYVILKNKQTREDFLRDNHHRIRFVYTPKHSLWMNQIEIWFGIISRKLLKRMSYSSVGHLKESILQFITQYNVSAHPFKWTYAGIPLTV